MTHWRPMLPSHRNQSSDLVCKPVDWVLCGKNTGINKFTYFLRCLYNTLIYPCLVSIWILSWSCWTVCISGTKKIKISCSAFALWSSNHISPTFPFYTLWKHLKKLRLKKGSIDLQWVNDISNLLAYENLIITIRV